MSVDEKMVRRIAQLARIGVADDKLPELARELSAILEFVEQLNAVDTEGVAPFVHAIPMAERDDEITDGGCAEDVLANAPARDDDYFAVPKVIE